jgi:ribulose kinase
MFRESVDGTLSLIRQQVGQVQNKGLRVRTIFLSGGFSRNQYLYNRVYDLAQRGQFLVLRGDEA